LGLPVRSTNKTQKLILASDIENVESLGVKRMLNYFPYIKIIMHYTFVPPKDTFNLLKFGNVKSSAFV